MIRRRVKIEQVMYAAAFLLALVLRLAGAARLPLTNREADLALQALALAQGHNPLIGPYPAYLVLTTLLMYVFTAGSWVARFWPAAAGSLLVLLPLLFRSRIGKLPAVLLAFGLAFDPGLLAVSREAGSLSLALFFTLLAFGLWLNDRKALAGIAAGMALLSGPQVWPGILGLGIALWAVGRAARPEQQPVERAGEAEPPVLSETAEASRPAGWKLALICALATVFFAGTLFFIIPDGLSAAAESIPTYLRGWVSASGVALTLLLVALLAYELLPLLLGLWGGVRGLMGLGTVRSNLIDRFLLAWWAAALVLALVYPGRQVQDLVWSILPMWGLAARQIARLVTAPAYDRLPALGQMLLAAVILTYVSMTLVSVANAPSANPVEYRVRLIGALVMLAATTGLIAWGWSRRVALRGLTWGAGIVLLIYFLSAGWNALGLAVRSGEELWSSGPELSGASLLMETIGDLSRLGPQEVGGPNLVVVNTPSPALRWLLRGMQRVSYAGQLPTAASPALVITANQPDLALSASYRGQNFVVAESINWNQISTADWFRWATLRAVPDTARVQDRIILWARADLFPGGTLNAPGASQTQNQSNP